MCQSDRGVHGTAAEGQEVHANDAGQPETGPGEGATPAESQWEIKPNLGPDQRGMKGQKRQIPAGGLSRGHPADRW